MIKKISILLALISALLVPSCTQIEEVEMVKKSGGIAIVPQVAEYTSKVVGTKALSSKEGDESLISNMALFMFDKNGRRLYDRTRETSHYFQKNITVFQLSRTALQYSPMGSIAPEVPASDDLAPMTLYIVSNIADENLINTVTSLSELRGIANKTGLSFDVDGISEPGIGFPMVGELELDLSDSGVEDGQFVIPLTSLYSKIRFTINLDPIQTTDKEQSFKMTSWQVFNIPGKVYVRSPGDAEETTHLGMFNSPLYNSDEEAKRSSPIEFFFYMPEHKVIPDPSNVVNYPWDPSQDTANKEFKQHWKPALVGHNVENPAVIQPATYVEIKGVYSDHNGRKRNVTYTIFLGQNTDDDFFIQRNHLYNNVITIKGLTNDISKDPNTISYDLRINVERPVESRYISFGIERETLLDSHWEIRPLRIVLKVPDESFYSSKVVVRMDANDWVRMEMPTDEQVRDNVGGVYCVNPENDSPLSRTDLAYGKRKYFTDDLVTSTLAANTEYTINAKQERGDQEHTIWVYIDENTVSHLEGNRKMKLYFDYYKNGSAEPYTEEYAFIQKDLFEISEGETYKIEYYEEYLYNYDSNDLYGNTQDGMQWGLEGFQLSDHDHAVYLAIKNSDFTWDGSGNSYKNNAETLINTMNNGLKSEKKYDFYLTRDIRSITGSDEAPGSLTPHNHSGYSFTQKISNQADLDPEVAFTLSRATNDKAESAIEYCINKNKREPDGSIDLNSIHWYLPAIDEIEEITKGGYSEFAVFQSNLYWSSQPAYKMHGTKFVGRYLPGNGSGYINVDSYGSFFEDHLERARATLTTMNNGISSNVTSATNTNGSEYIWDVTVFEQSGKFAKNSGSSDNITTEVPRTEDIKDGSDATYDPGNQPRNSLHRIRCVYKP